MTDFQPPVVPSDDDAKQSPNSGSSVVHQFGCTHDPCRCMPSPQTVIAHAAVYDYRGTDGLGSDLIDEEGPSLAGVIIIALHQAGYEIVKRTA